MKKGSLIISIFCAAIILCGGGIFSLTKTQSTLNAHAQTSCAASMAVIETSSGRLLYHQNAFSKRAMASTTKICTAITVIENCHNLSKTVRIPERAVGIEGSSIYLQKNEPLTIVDLLYGLMLQSGNDCAVALAITVGGSVDGFAKMMNETAQRAGAKNSNFVNPHGLHNDNHYTTAYDLAMITRYAMQNPAFKKIVATKSYKMPWEGRNYPRKIVNKNKILNMFEGGDGVKTGFTKKAGRCLVSSATRNGMQVIAVVLNCGPMFEECCTLMSRAFNEYELKQVAVKGNEVCQTQVERGKSNVVGLGTAKDVYYPLKKNGSETVEYKVETEPLKAPLKTGVFGGTIKFYLQNQLLFSEDLVTINEVKPMSVADWFNQVLRQW